MNVKEENKETFLFCIGKETYISTCLIGLIIMVGLNSFFFIFKEALGYGMGSFFFTSDDRFADLIKTAFSYKKVLSNIPHIDDVVKTLDPLYQYYYYRNPYGGIENITGLTHFHLTPFSTLLQIIVGITLGNGLQPNFILLSFFVLCMVFVYLVIYTTNKSKHMAFAMVDLILVSYPLLFLVTRGNYHSFICSIGVIAFMNALFIVKKVDLGSMLLFAVAVNIRPSAIILLFALPLVLKNRDSFTAALKIIILSMFLFVLTYLAVHEIYTDYNLNTFLQGLSSYNNLYIEGGGGDNFNSSLHGAIKLIGYIFNMTYSVIRNIFYVLSLMVLSIVGLMFFLKERTERYLPFVLLSIYVLLNPVYADYHLLIFVIPIFLIYAQYEHWEKDKVALTVITVSSLLLLSPKNYIDILGISLQVLVNPLIMLVSSAFLLRRSWFGFKEPG